MVAALERLVLRGCGDGWLWGQKPAESRDQCSPLHSRAGTVSATHQALEGGLGRAWELTCVSASRLPAVTVQTGFRPVSWSFPFFPVPGRAVRLCHPMKKPCPGSPGSLKPDIPLISTQAWEPRAHPWGWGWGCLLWATSSPGLCACEKGPTSGARTRSLPGWMGEKGGGFYSPQDLISGQEGQRLQQTTER